MKWSKVFWKKELSEAHNVRLFGAIMRARAFPNRTTILKDPPSLLSAIVYVSEQISAAIWEDGQTGKQTTTLLKCLSSRMV